MAVLLNVTGTLASATSQYVDVSEAVSGITVAVLVGTAASGVKVRCSSTPNAASLGAAANWVAWDYGTNGIVTSDTLGCFPGVLQALEFTRQGASGTASFEVTG